MSQASDFRGKRVTVVGLGTLGGGVGTVRYLAGRGARVTVTDMRSAEELASSLRHLDGLPVVYHLGGHEVSDFLPEGADFVVRNPGVPRSADVLKAARDRGVPIEMEMSLFFRECPAPIIGVTGTKGKTTVSALVGHMLTEWNPSSVVAGNMGVSALAALDRITAETPVVIELSSWQLEALDEHALGPAIAVLTNIYEDHLTHYDGFEDYAATKRTIGAHLGEDGIVVFNAGQFDTRRIADHTRARKFPFGREAQDVEGAWLDGDALVARWSGAEQRYDLPAQLALRGPAGIENALAAVAAATARGVPADAIAKALASFTGVPNRLQQVGSCAGSTFINDTSATAPVAAAATIRLLAEDRGRLVVIAGGADKGSDFAPLADAFAETDADLILLDGSGTARLRECLRERGISTAEPYRSLPEAFEVATSGDIPRRTIVLSPGCASFGMFLNEFDRGEQFCSLAHAWCAARQPVET
jgi:UDP-N-acetylmuramoylalanine--D-glutamate ligase